MTKNKKKKGSIVLNIFIVAVFLTGAGIFLYPTISDMWNQYRNAQLISTYDQAVTGLSDDSYEKLWKEAEEYNILVAEQKDVKNTIRFKKPEVTYNKVSGRVTKLVYEQK